MRLLRGITGHFAAQCEALGHAKAVLLVDDGQRQILKLHLVLNDRVRAHHQAGRAAFNGGQGFAALGRFLTARQPSGLQAQRFQPIDQLAEMLLGQNFGGCHQRALPARVHAAHGSQRRHHGFARAHVALQQAVHGPDFLQIASNLGVHPLLRSRQRKGQARHQLRAQVGLRCVHGRHQGGRTHGVALAPGLQLRELLSQQLLGFEANPGRVAAVFQRGQ